VKENLYYYRFVLDRVIDGDTVIGEIDLGFKIFMKNQNLRLLYIDAPEVRGLEKEKGLLSKEFLINLITNKDIIIHSFNRDSFGRVLAELFFYDDENWFSANTILLNEGFALPYE
jgi:micrococcal nuclease